MKTYRKPNDSYFPNRWPLSYLNLTKKYENTHKAPTTQKGALIVVCAEKLSDSSLHSSVGVGTEGSFRRCARIGFDL